MRIKDQVLDLIQGGYDHIQAFVAGLNDEARATTGPDDLWSAKDHLAHIAAWQLHHLEPQPGETDYALTSQDVNAINAEIYTRHHDRPWAEVLADLQRAYDLETAHIQHLSEEDLLTVVVEAGRSARPAWRVHVSDHYTHVLQHLAQYYLDRQQPDQGLEYYRLMVDPLLTLDDSAEWQGVTRYNQACLYALAGSPREAIPALRDALTRVPDLVAWSKEDPDLDSLRAEPAYLALMAELDRTPSPAQE